MIRDFIKKHKAATVCMGDIIVYFASLAAMLFIRYGASSFFGALAVHRGPFSALLALWLTVFAAADLYTYTTWRTTLESAQLFGTAILCNFFLSISVFYLFGKFFALTPKVNLLLFTALFAVLDCAWRFGLARLLASRRQTHTVIMLATSALAETVIAQARNHPQLGYSIRHVASAPDAADALRDGKHASIVVDEGFLKDERVIALLSGTTGHRDIKTLADFYETLLGRVPLSEIGEAWFLTEIRNENGLYDSLKRAIDVCLAIFGIILFSPVFLALFIAIPLASNGPALYAQKRLGKNGAPFMLYKFRTMHLDAEKTGAVWSTENDDRVTPLGAFLRKSHLDELPQLFNILRGDLAFVGPRPERPEFTETLVEKVPFYTIRQTIKPGLTGWAQINYHYGGSIEGTAQKLEYDIYYLKHRSSMLDLIIMLKTIREIF